MSQKAAAAISKIALPWYKNAGKLVTAGASTGAAIVSIVAFLNSYGIIGEPESAKTIGNLGAAWVGLRPTADTATSIGDTLHLAATITDRNGTVLIGARPTWTSENPSVAVALPNGTVIAKGPGRTTITIAVGNLLARSQVLVRQRVATLEVLAESGDSVIVVNEGVRRSLRVRALDARGNPVASALDIDWTADDSTVAIVDSTGSVTGGTPGRTIVTAAVGAVQGHAAVTVAQAPAALAAVAGASQWAPAGDALPQQVVVRVTSRRAKPVEGALVRFRLADGAGRVSPEAALTDADGRARTTWTLGELPGRQTLLASVDQVDSALAVVAEAEPLGSNTRVAPLAETPMAGAGQALAAVAGVRVTDSAGRALVGVPVSWVALDGAAEAVDARTDSLGEARVKWTLGPRAGRQRLRVQVGSGRGEDAVAPLTLTADALAGAPAALTVTSGDAQRGIAGAPLPRAVVIRVVDAARNGVAGVSLALAPAAGSVPDTVVQTDSTGTARVQWTLGRTMGEQTLAVRVAGVPKPMRVTARAVPGPPANIAFDDGPGARGVHKLVALVTDEYGNPVPNSRLRLSASAGSVSPERAVSDAEGRVTVTWRPGPRGGEQKLTARVVGGDARGEFVTQLASAQPAAKAAPVKAPTATKAAKPNLAKPAAKGTKATTKATTKRGD